MASRPRKPRNKRAGRDERRLTVRGIRRDPVDIPKLSKALIGLALAEAERQAQADQAARDAKSPLTSDTQQPGRGADD